MNSLFSFLGLLMLFTFQIYASDSIVKPGLFYNHYVQDQHVIHVLTIDPKYFSVELVKAHNQVIGRETVEAIGLRTGAVAAINSGFFEIGNSEDGRPSLTLMIHGQLFGLRKQLQSLLILDQGNLQITQGTAKISLEVDKTLIIPNQINFFSNSKDISLYNDVWAPTSLTPYTNREVLIDNNFIVTEVSNHGDNLIPIKGLVLSFPAARVLPVIKQGDHVKLHLEFIDKDNSPIKLSKTASIVSGIPLLVQDGKSVNKWPIGQGITEAHARTALGVRSDGTIIIVVAEHLYKQSIKSLTLGQISTILRKEKNIAREKLTISEVVKILEKKFSDKEVRGLTIQELADYMTALGCVVAINLDGGGSSTLFMEGKILNNPTGDKEEALGEKVLRPVSDAIIIKQL